MRGSLLKHFIYLVDAIITLIHFTYQKLRINMLSPNLTYIGLDERAYAEQILSLTGSDVWQLVH
jgi:hypothetical protein